MNATGRRVREPVPDAVLDRLACVVGARHAIRDADELAPRLRSWRDNWVGAVPLLVEPANTDEVGELVRICAETGTPIVPQGGNTGLTGASQPHDDMSEVIVSLRRLNRIEDIDTLNDTMTVGAGCILADLQAAAGEADRLFPLSLAAEGSCQIGGNLATNAGGTQVLRYGNARALVLGLEVVLADGRVWNGLKALRKDNTGYDLKQLFIGAEGTLGIITRAVLKLFPKPSETQTALIGVPDAAAAVALLGDARAALGEQVTAFEAMQAHAVAIAVRHVPGTLDPFAEAPPWYVLFEAAGQGAPGSLREATEAMLAAGLEAGRVLDAVIADSTAQSAALWKIREAIPEAQNHEGASIKHDVSVPLAAIPRFLERADTALRSAYPGIRIVAFGHIGDGNMHYNPAQPANADPEIFRRESAAINRIVHDIVANLDGSISAEHGLGRLRMKEAERYKSEVELDLMRTLKRALDPQDIFNPGKVIDLGR